MRTGGESFHSSPTPITIHHNEENPCSVILHDSFLCCFRKMAYFLPSGTHAWIFRMPSSLLKISQTNRPFTAAQTKEMTLFQIRREWREQISRSKNSIFLNFRRCVRCIPTALLTNLLHCNHIRKGNAVEIRLSSLRDSYMCISSLGQD